MTNKLDIIVKDLSKCLIDMSKAELWDSVVNQYYKYFDTRNKIDFEIGRFAYLEYKRKNGKKIFKHFETRFNKPNKITVWLLNKKIRRRAKKIRGGC